MSLLSRAQELEDVSDAQLDQLLRQGSEAGDSWLAATEKQRRKDMRDRYAAQEAKQQAANPPDIITQRMAESGGGIPSADPNMQGPDPSLQTGIAGPPPGMAGGGLISGYHEGGGIDYHGHGGGPGQHLLEGLPTSDTDVFYTGDQIDISDPPWGVPDPRDWTGTPEEYEARLAAQAASTRRRTEDIPSAGYEEYLEGVDPRYEEVKDYEAWKRTTVGSTPSPGIVEMWKKFTTQPALRELARNFNRSDFELLRDRPAGQSVADVWRLRDAPTAAARRAGVDVDSDAITYDPNTGRAMKGGQFYDSQDDHEYGNMDQLLAMQAAAAKANDRDEYDKIQVGIDSLKASMARRNRGIDRDYRIPDHLDTGGDSIQDVLDRLQKQGSPGRDLQDVWADMEGRVGDFQASQRESPADRAYYARELAAKKRGLEMAGGIRSLDRERLTEQERLLAKGLGISEDRIAELMREMDTPEQIGDRRQGAAYGALSSMFLNPDLAAGIGGMGKKITDMDDILRAERKTALTEIRAERQTGFDFENLKREGIFDLTRKSQQEYDMADIAVDNMEATILKAKAEQGRAGELEAMKGYLDLLKSQASQIGAWNSTMAQVDAEIRTAMMSRESELAKSGNWESIVNLMADVKGSSMMENPDTAKWVEDTERIIMMAKVGQHGDEARAMLAGTPPPTIQKQTVQTRTPTGGSRTGSRSGVSVSVGGN